MYIYIYIYIYTYTYAYVYIYIYIYIYMYKGEVLLRGVGTPRHLLILGENPACQVPICAAPASGERGSGGGFVQKRLPNPEKNPKPNSNIPMPFCMAVSFCGHFWLFGVCFGEFAGSLIQGVCERI